MANPMFNEERMLDLAGTTTSNMSVNGTITKTLILLLIATITAVFTYALVISNPGLTTMLWIGSVVLGIITSIVIYKNPSLAPSLALIYAAIEGVLLGSMSAFFNGFEAISGYSPMITTAITITMGIFLVMLGLYGTRIIVVTERLRSTVIGLTAGVMLLYLVSFGLSFFGIQMPVFYDSSPLGIGFSVFVIGLAAFNLLVDFDFIENAERQRLPKYYEWFGAVALLATIVWLYFEVLRLLWKMQRD